MKRSLCLILFFMFSVSVHSEEKKDTTPLCEILSACIENKKINKEELPSFMVNFFKKSYEEQYSYFSEDNKANLERVSNIKNAQEYARSKIEEQQGRVILKDKILEVEHRRSKDNSYLNIVILICWTKDGHSGISTISVFVEKTNNEWKITDIIG